MIMKMTHYIDGFLKEINQGVKGDTENTKKVICIVQESCCLIAIGWRLGLGAPRVLGLGLMLTSSL